VTSQSAQQNGLTRWREGLRLERESKLARLAELRQDATEEIRDGQTFRVVLIPDSYGERGNVLLQEAPP
jgi:hypothetical protein